MSTIKLTRPKLDAGEKIYFGGLVKGFLPHDEARR